MISHFCLVVRKVVNVVGAFHGYEGLEVHVGGVTLRVGVIQLVRLLRRGSGRCCAWGTIGTSRGRHLLV